MYSVLVILAVIVAILLVFIVSIQESKGGGLASNFSASNQIMGVRKTTERDLDLQKLLGSMAKEEILHVDCLPCINECVLKQMLSDVAHNIIDVKGIEQAVDARKPLLWYSLYDYFYEALLAVAQMQDFYLQHGAGFHMTDPAEIWQSYCDDFYKMDSYYMSFYQQYRNVKQSTYNELDDFFKQAAEVVDNLYNNWYLANLTQNWTNAAGKQLAETGYIEGIEQQTDFYEKHVAQATSRTFVIISETVGKLQLKWDGPFLVASSSRPGSYRLKDMDGNDIPRSWNADELRRYYV